MIPSFDLVRPRARSKVFALKVDRLVEANGRLDGDLNMEKEETPIQSGVFLGLSSPSNDA